MEKTKSAGRFNQRGWTRAGKIAGAGALALSLAGCGGSAGEGRAVEEGAETVGSLLRSGHVPEIPRLPEVPVAIVHQDWTVASDGRTIQRTAFKGNESYSESVTMRIDAAEDNQITGDDVEQIECYAKVTILGPNAVIEYAEGRSVYQQQGGTFQLVQNELDQGFPGSPCEVVEKAIPENE